MAGEADIALLRLTGERGITPDARRGASSLCTQRCASSSRASSARTSRPSRSLAGRSSAVRRITLARDGRPDAVHPDARGTEAPAVVASAKGRFRPPAPGREGPACRPRGRSVIRLDSRAPTGGRGPCGSRSLGGGPACGGGLERLAGLEGGGDPGSVLPLPAPGCGSPRMRAASETRNLLLCPTDQATLHS